VIKQINIANKDKTIKELERFNCKHYESIDIEFCNVHLTEINKISGKRIFDKNSLFVRSSTLWEIMQPLGDRGKHNFHGLKAEDIFSALKSIKKPYCVFICKESRIAIATIVENCNKDKLLLIIELHSGLENDRFANINKLVSLYPKKKIDNMLLKVDSKDILFRKEK